LVLLPLLVSPFISYVSVDISLILTALFFLLALFFRDPDRKVGEGIVSPADGRVLYAFDDNGTKKIAVFMSVLDVHVNRAPCDGKVLSTERGRGKHAPAYSDHARNNAYVLTDLGAVKVRQVSGAFARRIVTYLRSGVSVRRGDRIGLIRFGSRVELYAQVEGEIRVRKGDRVIAGETTLID